MRSDMLFPEDALLALRGGKLAALAVLRPHIRRMAAKQYRDFARKLPAWVEREDVEQELTIQVLKSARAWSPACGGGIGMYVGWGSLRRLRRVLNHWRGASLHGRESRNPSRAEIAFCRAFGPDVDPLAKAPPVAADQAESADGARVFDALVRGAATTREALVLLKRGSQDGALSPDEARAMALRWFAVAEATESDQLVSEALRATGADDEAQDRLFGYLRKLRDRAVTL